MTNRTDVIPVCLDDGTVIQIEVTKLGGEEEVGASNESLSFTNVIRPVKKIATEIGEVIRDIQPDKAIVSLGFEIATSEGQLTALLVKGTATANLAVTLEWVKKKKIAKSSNPGRRGNR